MASVRSEVSAVFVGVATLDAIALVDGYPGADERTVSSEIAYAGGGPAATSAVAASRLGITSAYVGSVGDDANGRAILAGLESEGVDVSGVAILRGQSSAASVVIVDRLNDTRAISTRPAPHIDISRGRSLMRSAALVHVDHAGWAPVHASGLVRDGQTLSLDAGNDIDAFSPSGVGLYAPTVVALRRRYGHDLDVADLLGRAVEEGCDAVVATAGAEGSWARTADGSTAHAPSHAVEVLSTLGAGDVFHGALVAAVLRGLPLGQQLAFANIAAALSCRGLDGRSGIPRLAEVLEALPAITPVS